MAATRKQKSWNGTISLNAARDRGHGPVSEGVGSGLIGNPNAEPEPEIETSDAVDKKAARADHVARDGRFGLRNGRGLLIATGTIQALKRLRSVVGTHEVPWQIVRLPRKGGNRPKRNDGFGLQRSTR